MKQQRFRYRMLAFLTIGLLVAAGVYGVYSVSTYGSRWFANARNTRYQTAKKTVVPGDIIDRNGVVLATSDTDGNRVYQSNVKSRSAIVHLLGITRATWPTAWSPFRPTICWASKPAFPYGCWR